MNMLLERISIDPAVCGGKLCIKGTLIWVSLILDFLADGMTEAELLAQHPHLVHEMSWLRSVTPRQSHATHCAGSDGAGHVKVQAQRKHRRSRSDGRIVFPFNAIRVDVVLRAA
jgi:hypothetical protein